MIKLIVLDVDGTLTDGTIAIDNKGNETKFFNIKDGMGIVSAQKRNYSFAVISGRKSKIVEIRCSELGITDLYQGINEKIDVLHFIMKKQGLNYIDIAYIGDDINDIECMKKVGFSACPNDAISDVKNVCNFVSKYDGGKGAVREIIDYIMEKCV